MDVSKDITVIGMVFAYVVIFGSILLFRLMRINLITELLLGVARMGVQLALVGAYLTVLFKYNNLFVNIAYIFLMLCVANYSLLKNSGLRLELFSHTLPALVIGIGFTLTFFTLLVFTPEPLYEAKYMIPIAGMLLGNSMNRTIVTLERFYTMVKKDYEGYASFITMGATVEEAMMPYMRTAYKAGVAPYLANMATMGIVSLPGMMTGQILGGASPMVAIKYQIAIILAIYVATELSTLLVIFFSLRRGFDRFGFLRMSIFKVDSFG
jgi:UDP-glucose/iron transport system permease protein